MLSVEIVDCSSLKLILHKTATTKVTTIHSSNELFTFHYICHTKLLNEIQLFPQNLLHLTLFCYMTASPKNVHVSRYLLLNHINCQMLPTNKYKPHTINNHLNYNTFVIITPN